MHEAHRLSIRLCMFHQLEMNLQGGCIAPLHQHSRVASAAKATHSSASENTVPCTYCRRMWSELTSTHYWDCNGGACDAPMLQPWNERLYSFAPQYAPQRPPGGTGQYGETLWLAGAASDSLSKLLGGDDECCGRDDTNVGGCGRCILARNPLAQSNLTAVIMKKSRCPPETNLCSEGSVHMDIAVPGFEFISESTANVCGSADRLQTWLTKAQSGACATSTVGSGCDCSWTMAKTNCGTDDGSQCWSACCAPTSPTTDGASSCCDQIVANGRPARQRLFDG